MLHRTTTAVSFLIVASFLHTPAALAGPSPGKRVDVAELGVSLVLPSGWQGRLGTGANGQPAYQIVPAGFTAQQAGVGVSTGTLSAQEARLPMGELVRQAAAELQQTLTQGAMQNGTLLQWDNGGRVQTSQVNGRPAGRIVVRGGGTNLTGKKTSIELYLGIVRDGERAALVIANWEQASSGKLRPGTDALFESLRPEPLKATAAAQSRLAGCWYRGSGETSYGGGSYGQVKLRLAPNGSYRRESYVSVSVAGGSGGSSNNTQQGRWQQVGSNIAFAPMGDAPYSVPARLNGGMLMLGGDRYLPCD